MEEVVVKIEAMVFFRFAKKNNVHEMQLVVDDDDNHNHHLHHHNYLGYIYS